jgi:iron complex transport system substrate-binding protein
VRRALFLLLLWLSAPAAEAACPRIVSQSPYITHSLDWLGLKDCIVGVSRYDKLDLPRTGGILDPDQEAIAVLKPDLMLTANWIGEEAWQAAAPKGAKAVRLDGFRGMRQVEDNLRTIARAAALPDAEARAGTFASAWREKAKAVHGNGRRALLLSACSGAPYTFGPDTWLHDLFIEAGFTNVETHPRLRHLRVENPVAALDDLIGKLRPELVFVFERKYSDQCAAILPRTGVRIVALDGEQFLHPAPVLLKGLDTLAARFGR